MKTTILANGTLSIAPESDLEAYALGQWSAENITTDWFDVKRPQLKIIIDMTGYPDAMGVALMVPQP